MRALSLAATALAAATAAQGQMAHPPGMSHSQVIQAASAGGPASISQAGSGSVQWTDLRRPDRSRLDGGDAAP